MVLFIFESYNHEDDNIQPMKTATQLLSWIINDKFKGSELRNESFSVIAFANKC